MPRRAKQPSSSPDQTFARQQRGPPAPPEEKPKRPKTAYVLVMGSTGAGKSTLINHMVTSNGSNLGMRPGSQSGTAAVNATKPFKFQSYQVILAEVPAFDAEVASDVDVFITIASYLVKLCRKGIKVLGVLYLCRMTDNRLDGTTLQNLRMFRAICGMSAMRNVVVVLTMWDQVDPQLGEQRESELRESSRFFGPVMADNPRMMHHNGSKDSAMAILNNLVSQNLSLVFMSIQSETVTDGKVVHQTEAGRVLMEDLNSRKLMHEEKLDDVRRDIAQARSGSDDEGDLKTTEKSLEDQQRKLAEECDRLACLSIPDQSFLQKLFCCNFSCCNLQDLMS
ncbi:hypothetical protein DAEQUDRAFT_683039 [Daedalea quercina L-15889]|uniref:G domain-containing protein n=1 Tax=Daedalea quercina L-15889 TaxID=1314783 RepID=A0A165TZH5_9APHY|nr:hypothetical protein DAEQUDRAFT_683039 [Daedalea quercina L-15889]